MRGDDKQQLDVFSYISPEQRILQGHPLRPARAMADNALRDLKPSFSKLYAKTRRPSIAQELPRLHFREFSGLMRRILFILNLDRGRIPRNGGHFLMRDDAQAVVTRSCVLYVACSTTRIEEEPFTPRPGDYFHQRHSTEDTSMKHTNAMPLRLDSVERGRPVTISVDGENIQAYEGESLAAALLASGRRVIRHTHPDGQPRGLFCGMGVCYECLVTVAGRERVRACIIPVQDGMCVSTRME